MVTTDSGSPDVDVSPLDSIHLDTAPPDDVPPGAVFPDADAPETAIPDTDCPNVDILGPLDQMVFLQPSRHGLRDCKSISIPDTLFVR